jgi:hypothetical protein
MSELLCVAAKEFLFTDPSTLLGSSLYVTSSD